MGYLVLARKYRPQTFGEMSGQEHVVRTLSNALSRGRLAHAFLFTGPRGVGKTTAARLVAKAVNCEKGPTATPCGTCVACVEITEGRSVDVIEIDAASNNGVDNVRDIVEGVKYRPARDPYKVFVVDEVHMLSTGAFNALLKTLEEPPPHVIFVLATTDVHKVPETIVSRCQRFDFRRLDLRQISDQLGKVAAAEGMKLSGASLALVARAAEGGMRDALSLLDRVRAACGDEPGDDAVAEALGVVDAAAVARMATALVRRDPAGLLAEVAALYERGPGDAAGGRGAGPLPPRRDRGPARTRRPARPARGGAEGRPGARRRGRPGPGVPAVRHRPAVGARGEARRPAALRARGGAAQGGGARARGRRGGAARPRRGAGGREAGGGGAGAAAARPVVPPVARAVVPAPAPVAKAVAVPAAAPVAAPCGRRFAPAAVVKEASPAVTTGALAAAADAAPAAVWRSAVSAVEAESPTLGSALKQATLVALGSPEVRIRFPAGTRFPDMVERKRAAVEKAFSSHLGRPVKLAIEVGPVQATPDVPAPVASIASVERAEREARAAKIRDEARTHPRIQDAAKLLGADIEGTDEL